MNIPDKITRFLAEQHFRFQLGTQFLTFVNFTLLSITASEKINSFLHIKTTELLIILIPLAFFGTWLFGFILDVVVRYPHQQSKIATERTPVLNEILSEIKDIKEKINKLEDHK